MGAQFFAGLAVGACLVIGVLLFWARTAALHASQAIDEAFDFGNDVRTAPAIDRQGPYAGTAGSDAL